ncbi:NeuD/PglB/VioB family sugar acetyltransferase [Nocardioides sp.]|uniref:NeuD/PglB/VioB family sugar acetyltransferase n=1 Tax=Nocardioides sp. TaxID=35761 RepID=UPI00286DC9A1|nr:NeuD/PglB/VioB family sugar acetyltransferase [Nocardioides sp.]
MTALVLVGAGGLTREAMNIVRASDESISMRVLDDNPATWGSSLDGVEVAGGLDLLGEYADHQVVVCMGRGTLRRTVVQRIRHAGVARERFASLVHPRVLVPANCSVGVGSVVMEGVVLTADVTVGDHVVLMPHDTLTHGNVVHDYATICAGVALGGDVEVGPEAYVGMNACVRERVRIGRRSTLGMGAVLLHDLPGGETWVGSPAHTVNPRLEVAR